MKFQVARQAAYSLQALEGKHLQVDDVVLIRARTMPEARLCCKPPIAPLGSGRLHPVFDHVDELLPAIRVSENAKKPLLGESDLDVGVLAVCLSHKPGRSRVLTQPLKPLEAWNRLMGISGRHCSQNGGTKNAKARARVGVGGHSILKFAV